MSEQINEARPQNLADCWNVIDQLEAQVKVESEGYALLRERVERYEKALRLIESPVDVLSGGSRILHGNANLPGCEDFYRGYNAGIDGQHEKTAEIARAALAGSPAPQPAPYETDTVLSTPLTPETFRQSFEYHSAQSAPESTPEPSDSVAAEYTDKPSKDSTQ